MMPLAMVGSGRTTNSKRISGCDETKRHLANLGFVEGEDVTVVSEAAGNLILNVKGTRIALDKKMAMRILI